MNQLTQYQLNYIATFIPQCEQGILNFVCKKFNNPKLKVSIYGLNNENLKKWFCSYFGFDYDYITKISTDIYKFTKWIVENKLYFDLRILFDYNFEKKTKINSVNSSIIKLLIEFDLPKYIELLIKLQYISYGTIMIVRYYSDSNLGYASFIGLIPYCILKKCNNMLNWIIENIPKKNLMFDKKCEHQHTKLSHVKFNDGDLYPNCCYFDFDKLNDNTKKNFYDFLSKHDLLVDKN